MIDERDEWLHEVGSDPAWQESFYFNWADREGHGIVEHVWRATPEEIRIRAPRLAEVLGALRR